MSDTSSAQSSAPQPLRIFLCHYSGDKSQVRELYQKLRADGYLPWFDAEDLLPGQDWELEIKRAVRRSDVVIVCLSTVGINTPGYRHKETKLALEVAAEQPEGTIFIIPLKLEECDVPERLKRWHWINFFAEDGDARLKRALELRAASR